MKYTLFILFSLFCIIEGNAQSSGDTISIQAFNFNSTSRDTVISFPNNQDVSFEKILLKYTMRCKDGLVSNSSNTNLGCGEWDYSCNTYLVDSSKIEIQLNSTPNYHITNFSDLNFIYKESPVYDYLRGIQSNVEIVSTNSETQSTVGSGVDELSRVLSTNSLAGKSQYLYTAVELADAGLVAGNIDGLSLNVLSSSGEANYLKIKIKHNEESELNGQIGFNDFTEVYYYNTTLAANQLNRFQFHTPFIWDGSSNVLVEFNFSNIDAESLLETIIEGENTTLTMGISATNEQEIYLANNAYIECDEYKGVSGSQNRTVEAWIKTTNGSNGEICTWGTNNTGQKWAFRFANGKLRVEVAGGGTDSSTPVNDGQWHHVACVLNGNSLSGISFYVDGVLDVNSSTGTTAINTITNSDSYSVRISKGMHDRYLDCIIDDVRIWDTNLSMETINNWRSLKVNDTHPNYDNLQLNYQFNESGNIIEDSSINSRNAALIGSECRVTETAGTTLFKDFILSNQRPNTNFYQGDYVIETITSEVDRPIAKASPHLVVNRSIEFIDPTTAVHDIVHASDPIEYWTVEENIYDEVSGDLIVQNILPADGELIISDLVFHNRYPFYNELVSFVTPYGNGLDLGMEGKSWFMDMSDYVTILNGDKRLMMTLGGQWQEDMDLEFLFIVGTPPQDVLQYEQIWQGTNRTGSAHINQILDDTKHFPQAVSLNTDATNFKLKSSITGHGGSGEFHQNGGLIHHKILLNDVQTFDWTITQECSENPIFPQGGTWVYDRQGWCPGERSLLTENDLTSFVSAGSSVDIDYTTSNPTDVNGDYKYQVAHQLLAYGAPNFQLDAAIVAVIAPNNSAEYERIGTICANPSLLIRNTGASELTQLTINYWLNESIAPQSYVWTGSLDFMEEEIVVIPSPSELWLDVLSDNNVFHAELSDPNQGNDEYVFNNTINSNFDIPFVAPHNLSIVVRTNNNPSQNSYQLLDGNGNIIGSNNLPSSNTTYTDDYSLIAECYKLIVTDTGDDGLQWWANPTQGNGYAKLTNENGLTIKTFEKDFGGRFEFSFTTDFPVSIEDLDFLTNIKVFPNPTSKYCTIETTDLSQATVYIIDMLGKEVTAPITNRSDNSISFNLQNLNSGVYFIIIDKGDVKTTRKLVIK